MKADGRIRIRIRIREAQNIRILNTASYTLFEWGKKSAWKFGRPNFWKVKFLCSYLELSYLFKHKRKHNPLSLQTHSNNLIRSEFVPIYVNASFFIYIKPTIIRLNLGQLLLFTRLVLCSCNKSEDFLSKPTKCKWGFSLPATMQATHRQKLRAPSGHVFLCS